MDATARSNDVSKGWYLGGSAPVFKQDTRASISSVRLLVGYDTRIKT